MHTLDSTKRGMLGCLRQSGPAFPPAPVGSSACANDLVPLQGLELLVTVLLARNRQPQPTVAAGAPPAEFAAELVTLPSGLLAMVCEAIVKLKVRLAGPASGLRACVRCRAWVMVPTRAQRLSE